MPGGGTVFAFKRSSNRHACRTVQREGRIALAPYTSAVTSDSARRKDGGNSFPRFPARRRIPAQAFALKKYRRGISPVSKMSDNEHATAPLGNSEELSVKNSVGEPIPEFCQPPEEGSKIPPSVRGQDTRDVFPDHPSGSKLPSNCQIDEHEIASRIIESLSQSRDAE
jgi:hypothetical protein